MKKYKLGVVCGRFQGFHNGHRKIIDEAINQCEKVVVLIGSAQAKGTLLNPFDYEFRKEMISRVYSFPFRISETSSFAIYPIDDLNDGYVAHSGDNTEWGKYLLSRISFLCGENPDAIFSGREAVREGWFSPQTNLDEIYVDRSDLPISSTQIRNIILNAEIEDDLQEVYKNIPAQLWRYIPRMKAILSEVYDSSKKIVISKYNDFQIFKYAGSDKLYREDFECSLDDDDRIVEIEEVMRIPYAEHSSLYPDDDDILNACEQYDVSYEEDIEIEECGGGDYVFANYVV